MVVVPGAKPREHTLAASSFDMQDEPETPEQQNFVGGDDGLEPAAEGAKIEEPVSND